MKKDKSAKNIITTSLCPLTIVSMTTRGLIYEILMFNKKKR